MCLSKLLERMRGLFRTESASAHDTLLAENPAAPETPQPRDTSNDIALGFISGRGIADGNRCMFGSDASYHPDDGAVHVCKHVYVEGKGLVSNSEDTYPIPADVEKTKEAICRYLESIGVDVPGSR